MADPLRALVVCGTRPDAIKLAPVIHRLKQESWIQTHVAATGQHREMLAQVLDAFEIQVDENFDVMPEKPDLAYLTSAILTRLDGLLAKVQPHVVLAQGDTTTTFVASLASFYRRIPFAHVEAGLRTSTVWLPFPEEFNRRATSLVAALHFAPTEWAADNLRREGVPEKDIFVTGNTSIDALLHTLERVSAYQPPAEGRMILVTTHRRENWGEPQRRIARAVKRILEQFPDTFAVVPMHRNPVVREVLTAELNHERAFLVEPPAYPEFAAMMKASTLVLTDSGGVQEEAPSLGKPVLVLREETERPEGVEAGAAMLVGTDPDAIFERASRLLQDEKAYEQMAKVRNPYGDGKAAERIVAAIRDRFASS
ncbi:MAG: UDP-N-acetylglucosamine 2-epimerase (non-hydrolyzing) [Armatimonadetes bacterium]|nr:MAG: UDP-N-acetylglucosamine 2-epimerase (non-hydrolyzing) [Armatimonadota bacterium]